MTDWLAGPSDATPRGQWTSASSGMPPAANSHDRAVRAGCQPFSQGHNRRLWALSALLRPPKAVRGSVHGAAWPSSAPGSLVVDPVVQCIRTGAGARGFAFSVGPARACAVAALMLQTDNGLLMADVNRHGASVVARPRWQVVTTVVKLGAYRATQMDGMLSHG